jgi:hypothetical protein
VRQENNISDLYPVQRLDRGWLANPTLECYFPPEPLAAKLPVITGQLNDGPYRDVTEKEMLKNGKRPEKAASRAKKSERKIGVWNWIRKKKIW